MVEPIVTPPVTPPVTPAGGNPAPAATPVVTPGNNPAPAQNPPAPFIMNQQQFDDRWSQKMTALETEIGMPIKDLKTFIETNKAKPKPTPGESLSGADLKIAKMEALMTAGVPSKQIPLLLQYLNIAGKTREELDASIQGVITAKLLVIEAPAPAQNPGNNQQQPQQPTTPNGAQGAGLIVPGGAQKKMWKASEIRGMSYEDHIKNKDEILLATKENRITYD
jgi:hypothetical protein